jgi:hypothetical protein
MAAHAASVACLLCLRADRRVVRTGGSRAQHSIVNETLCARPRSNPETQLPYPSGRSLEEGSMRTLIFGAALITVAAAGFHTLIAASLDAARDARPASFSERFAPVLKPV